MKFNALARYQKLGDKHREHLYARRKDMDEFFGFICFLLGSFGALPCGLYINYLWEKSHMDAIIITSIICTTALTLAMLIGLFATGSINQLIESRHARLMKREEHLRACPRLKDAA